MTDWTHTMRRASTKERIRVRLSDDGRLIYLQAGDEYDCQLGTFSEWKSEGWTLTPRKIDAVEAFTKLDVGQHFYLGDGHERVKVSSTRYVVMDERAPVLRTRAELVNVDGFKVKD